jgi:endonuclease YncB( thermonuclease family)
MKIRFTLFLVVILFFSLFFIEAAVIKGKCVQVEEGDIIKVLVNRKILHIRLEGIDCPEKGQAYEREATEWMKSMAFRKKVRVEVLSFEGERLIVGRVFVDEKDLSMELVNAGLAWYYRGHGKNRYLSKAQKKAKKKKIGIWSQKKPKPPWIYKQEMEDAQSDQDK